ncbi:MAG TPA: TonB-dependent receptor [Steroidobacteraceae bacterium]|nr:TonB-dependent receptor [Steroidobacteraceae bacterium]
MSIDTRAARIALAAVLSAASLAAEAQTVSTASSASSGALEEIVVTAQKREQNSQDIGISLSAISGQDLNKLGAVQATDITRSMPAVVLTQPNGPSSFSLAIRGVTQNDFADHQESPAAIYMDDVYVSQMAGLAFSMFDIDRVEVLRGPQGTLFGRNATGGLANFVTNRPTDEAGGYLDTTFGSHNLLRVEGAINGPVADGVDARLSFESNHYDPLFTNVSGGASDSENGNDYALRGQLLFKLPNEGQLLFIARGSRENVGAGSWEEYAAYNTGNGVDAFLPSNVNAYGTCPGCNATGLTNSGPFTIRDNISGYAKLNTAGLTVKYTQNLGFATLNLIGDYSYLRKQYQEDSDASPYTLFEFFNGSNVNQESFEARLNGGNDKLNWTAGLYGLRIDGSYYEGWIGPSYFSAKQFQNPGNPNNDIFGAGSNLGPWPYGSGPYWTTGGVPGPDGGIPETKSPYELLTKSGAAFGQVEYRATDLIGFTLGGRFTADRKDYHFTWYPYEYFPTNTTSPVEILSQPDGTLLSDYHGTRSDNLYSGKAQVDFHLSKDMLAYVSYNRGVKGGGFNAPLFPIFINDLSTLSFKPETLTSYEVGFKSEFLDHTLRFNAAAYYYNYQNYQALIYTLGLEQLIVNADAKHKGAEAEIDWAPTAEWRFGAGLAYVDAVVQNVGARCCNADGTLIVGNYTPGNAPRWSGNVMARYTMPFWNGHLAYQADGNYLSKFWFNITDVPDVEQQGFGLANLRINYSPAGDKIEVGASVENVANKHYGVMGFDNVSINGLAQVYPGMPRWYKVHVNYKF